MYQKLDNAAWEKYINEYSSLDKKISIKSFVSVKDLVSRYRKQSIDKIL